MEWLDLLDWLGAPTEKEKAEVWKRCHPNTNFVLYTTDPDIKRFWDSPLGRLYRDCLAIVYFFKNSGRRLDVLEWRIDWEWRMFMQRTISQNRPVLEPRQLSLACPYCEGDRFYVNDEGNTCFSCGAVVYGYQLKEKFSQNGKGSKSYMNNGSSEYREIIEYSEF